MEAHSQGIIFYVVEMKITESVDTGMRLMVWQRGLKLLLKAELKKEKDGRFFFGTEKIKN